MTLWPPDAWPPESTQPIRRETDVSTAGPGTSATALAPAVLGNSAWILATTSSPPAAIGVPWIGSDRTAEVVRTAGIGTCAMRRSSSTALNVSCRGFSCRICCSRCIRTWSAREGCAPTADAAGCFVFAPPVAFPAGGGAAPVMTSSAQWLPLSGLRSV